MTKNELLNQISDLIQEEVDSKVLQAMEFITEEFKSYVNNKLNENNNAILSVLEETLESKPMSKSNSNKYTDNGLVEKERQSLRESIRGMFSTDESVDEDNRSLSFTSNQVIPPIHPSEIRHLLPPDGDSSGGRMPTKALEGHSETVLDIAGGLQDESLQKALTRNYSNMIKKRR